LSPGIPRRPTAPREPSASGPAAAVSGRARTPRATAEHQMPHGRGNTASQARCQQQGNIHQQKRDFSATANRHRITVNSAHFARSQLQVNTFINYL